MSKRKSYRRNDEFEDPFEAWNCLKKYHRDVVSDLVENDSNKNRSVQDRDDPKFQSSHIHFGQGFYILSTRFDANGFVVHELEKIGASNRVVRARPLVLKVGKRGAP